MNKYEDISHALDEVIQSLIRLREVIRSDDRPAPKFTTGSYAYAKTIGENVYIEDSYYDNIQGSWCYRFHAPSAVMSDDYYSSYGEEFLESPRF